MFASAGLVIDLGIAASSSILRRFDEADVGAGFEIRVHAVERGLQAFDRARIGARDDHHVRVAAGIDGGLDLADHLGLGHELLAFVVAAFLRGDLVFEMKSGDAGLLVFAHAAHHVDRIAVTAVHVADDRNIDGFDRARDPLHVLGHGQRPMSG